MGNTPLNTLDEPIWETIKRDLHRIGGNLILVVFPFKNRDQQSAALRNWDLWGPMVSASLVLCVPRICEGTMPLACEPHGRLICAITGGLQSRIYSIGLNVLGRQTIRIFSARRNCLLKVQPSLMPCLCCRPSHWCWQFASPSALLSHLLFSR